MAAVLAAILALPGCSKKTSSVTPIVPPAAADQSQAQAAPPSSQPQAPQPGNPTGEPLVQPTGQPDLGAINRVLIRWIVGHKRIPADFQEFASTCGVSLPPPPPGQKFIITKNMHVQLASK